VVWEEEEKVNTILYLLVQEEGLDWAWNEEWSSNGRLFETV